MSNDSTTTADYIKRVMMKNGKADYISMKEYAAIAEAGSRSINKLTANKMSDISKSDKLVMVVISLGHMILSLLAHGSRYDEVIENEFHKTVEVYLKVFGVEWKGGDIKKLLADLIKIADNLDMDKIDREKYKLSVATFGLFLELSKEEPSHSLCMEVYNILNDLVDIL